MVGRDQGEIITISVTEDYEKLVPFFIENDLEFSEEDAVPTDLVSCWQARTEDGVLAGGCVLAKREGRFIIDGIATDPAYRGIELGRKLLDKALDEVKSQGGRELYLVARAPGFFRKAGFVEIPREDAPNFFECFTCPQYNVDCFPQVMRVVLT